ncbi:MAG TPA: hypothetical protein VEB67_03225 [Nitrososphaerales archaeon]|nr:hypothetical protein [Nitrososphaerales archaeon]
MADELVILASFLLAFKAILIEGSEVAILSLATIKQLGRNNVVLGVLAGGSTSVLIFLGVRQVFLLLPEYLIDIGTGTVILYFSYRFLRGFKRYYFGKRSFRAKMEKLQGEVVAKDYEWYTGDRPQVVPFSLLNSLPVFTITLTEGFEASLVLGAAGSINFEWTLIGAVVSMALIVSICAVSYEYLVRVPRWALDLIAGCVLLTFGSYFLLSGISLIAFGGS